MISILFTLFFFRNDVFRPTTFSALLSEVLVFFRIRWSRVLNGHRIVVPILVSQLVRLLCHSYFRHHNYLQVRLPWYDFQLWKLIKVKTLRAKSCIAFRFVEIVCYGGFLAVLKLDDLQGFRFQSHVGFFGNIWACGSVFGSLHSLVRVPVRVHKSLGFINVFEMRIGRNLVNWIWPKFLANWPKEWDLLLLFCGFPDYLEGFFPVFCWTYIQVLWQFWHSY